MREKPPSLQLDRSLLSLDRMAEEAERLRREYPDAEPFPHVVVDNLFDEAVVDRVLMDFPTADGIDWERFEAEPYEQIDKLESKGESQIPLFIRYFLYSLNSAPFIEFLERVTGIQGLIPDPFFEGAGLHQTLPGGRLMIHADFNRHRRLKLDRRLNAILYLNKDWKPDYGGYLELWDTDMTACRRRVLPVFNRLVIFGTTDFTYHGQPEPLACPQGMSRKSLALYYFTNGRPEHERTPKKHGTLWRYRPNESIEFGMKVRKVVRSFVPPIANELLLRFRK